MDGILGCHLHSDGALFAAPHAGNRLLRSTLTPHRSCYAPNVGGFTEMATKYADPALGFMSGINYTLSTGFGIPSEISAIAVLFTYWDHNTAHAPAYIALFIVLTVVRLASLFGDNWS